MNIADMLSTQRSAPAAPGATLAMDQGFAALMEAAECPSACGQDTDLPATSRSKDPPGKQRPLATENLTGDLPVPPASDDPFADIAKDIGAPQNTHAIADNTQARIDMPAHMAGAASLGPDLPETMLAAEAGDRLPDPATTQMHAAELHTHPLAAAISAATAAGSPLAVAPLPQAARHYLLPDPAPTRHMPMQMNRSGISLSDIAAKPGMAGQAAPATLPPPEAALQNTPTWVVPEDMPEDRTGASSALSGLAASTTEPGPTPPPRAITLPPPTDEGRLSALRHALNMAAQSDGSIEIDIGDEQQGRIRITLLRQDGGVQLALLSGRAELQEMMRKSLSLLRDDLAQLGYDDIHLSVHDADTRQTLASLGQRAARAGGENQGNPATGLSLPPLLPAAMDLRL